MASATTATPLTTRGLWLQAVCLFGLGGFATLGWEPVNLALIGFAAISILGLCQTSASSFRNTTVITLAYAIGFHAIGHGWIFQALLTQTAAGFSMSLIGTAVFVLYLSTFTLIPGLIYYFYIRKSIHNSSREERSRPFRWMNSIVFATLFTAGEYGRSLLFNGFTSLSVGHLFVEWPLRGWLSTTGVYGCSFLFYAAALVFSTKIRIFINTKSVKTAGAAASVSIGVLGSGAWLDVQTWVQPIATPVSFRLIQGSIAQEEKFSRWSQQYQNDHYIRNITSSSATIIATPETSFPSGLNELPGDTLRRLSSFSSSTQSNIFIGSPSISANGNAFNSIFLIAPDNAKISKYDKIRLMPFGEYAPTGFQSFTDRLSLHLNNLTAGQRNQQPFLLSTAAGPLQVGPLICNDDQTSDISMKWVPDAKLLLSSGNLAWFEGTNAVYQMLQIARVRAIETGRPVLKVANTGVTAHIDHQGRVIDQLDLAHPGVLSGEVQPFQGQTPFARWGGLIVAGLIGFFILAAHALDRRQVRP
jgi:apolipoprotein N-acyltransferase